jgi:transposase
MLTEEDWMEVKDLRRNGLSIREIARTTGLSRNSVRAILRERVHQAFQSPHRGSKLDPFKGFIDNRLKGCPLSAVRILEEIEPMGYSGSLDTVQRYIRGLRSSESALQLATVRFETPPGAQGQIDWAHCGRLDDSRLAYAFVMVLGFSRMLYVEFTASMDTATLLECHKRAFAYFGGWPRTLLYDNMKQVRLSAGELNPLLCDFANHYGFAVKTHRPYRPRTKGKVERMVSYVKESFVLGRAFSDLADINAQVRHWLDYTANVRIHATTGRRPADLLSKEGLACITSVAAYPVGVYASRLVDAEGFVHYAGSRYSVTPEHVGKMLCLAHVGGKVVLRAASDGLVVAEHGEATRRGSCIADPGHVAQFWRLTTRTAPERQIDWQQAHSERVETRPLSVYEKEAAA